MNYVIVSPRGVARGHESVRAFAARQSYGVRMVPAEQRYFARGETVVVYGTVGARAMLSVLDRLGITVREVQSRPSGGFHFVTGPAARSAKP